MRKAESEKCIIKIEKKKKKKKKKDYPPMRIIGIFDALFFARLCMSHARPKPGVSLKLRY